MEVPCRFKKTGYLFIALVCLSILAAVPAGKADAPTTEPNRQRVEMAKIDVAAEAVYTLDAPSDENELDSAIQAVMNTYHVPGVGTAIIKNGRIIRAKGYGLADVGRGISVTDTTSFMLASISKTMTAVALMRLWEQGYFGLDDNINDYLPFFVQNPNYPGVPITFRQLLTHTAGLIDNWDVMFSVYHPGDCPIALPYYVENYFCTGGQYYDADANFASWAPGSRWKYCNEAIALAGYLVEAVCGIDLDQYSRDSIFTPLDMRHTSWFFAGLDSNNIALPYHYNGSFYETYGHFGYADWPAGQLRSSARDMGRHLQLFLQRGEVDGVRILQPETVDTMLKIQFPSVSSAQGIIWFHNFIGGQWVWRHGGGDQGVRTMVSFCPDSSTGAVVLTNGESVTAYDQIMQLLYQFAHRDVTLAASTLSDALGGDADGVCEQGESIDVTVILRNNYPDTISDLSVAMTVDDARIIVTDGAALFPAIAPGETADNAGDPLTLYIPEDYNSRIDSIMFEVTWNGGAHCDTVAAEHPLGAPRILLIDDDYGSPYQTYYTVSLEALHIPWAREFVIDDAPTSTLTDYDVVIWFTGYPRAGAISSLDRTVIIDYFNSGGNLLLSGQGIAADLAGSGQTTFLNEYLHADYVSTEYSPVLVDDAGGGIFAAGDTTVIYGSSGADNQTVPDRLSPVNGGVGELTYLPDTVKAAISYAGDYRVCFLGFGLEAVVGSSTRWMLRHEALDRILTFLGYQSPTARPLTDAVTLPSEDITHVVDHTPIIGWAYDDIHEFPQEQYHIQVGTDLDWADSENWDSGPMAGSATTAVYGGAALVDGEDYYLRVRTHNGSFWSDWAVGNFHMNAVPVPYALVPAGMAEVSDTLPVLSQHCAIDGESDPLSFTFEVFADGGCDSLIESVSGLAWGQQGMTVCSVTVPLTYDNDYFWRAAAGDGFETGDWSEIAAFRVTRGYVCGDANADTVVDIGDAIYIINYAFKQGPVPAQIQAGDANCDDFCNVGDAVYLINYVFREGPSPCCP